MTYVPLVSTAIGGALAIGASFENGLLNEENTLQTVSGLTKSFRTPLWKSASFMAINDHDMNRPAVRLYETEVGVADAYPTWQMSLVGAVDSLPQTPDTIGHLEFDVIIDVYQLKRAQTFTGSPVQRQLPRTSSKIEEDYVSCFHEPACSASTSSVTSSASKSVPSQGKVMRA